MADATSSDEGSDSELTGSKLGKHSYWEQTYKKEIANLENLGDEGEVWCGAVVMRMFDDHQRSNGCRFLKRYTRVRKA